MIQYSIVQGLVAFVVVICCTLGTQILTQGIGTFVLTQAGLVGIAHKYAAIRRDVLAFGLSAIAGVVGYLWYVKIIEKRHADELDRLALWKFAPLGVFIGIVLFISVVGTIALFGTVEISFRADPMAFKSLAISLQSGVVEELLFRGIVFRLLERKLGSLWALTLSALFFGSAHLINEDSSIVTAVGVTLESGVLMAAAYIYARSLWFPIAIHFAWDAVESAVFGLALSGAPNPGLFSTNLAGSGLLTGGNAGPEGSLVSILGCAIVSSVLFYLSARAGRFRHMRIPSVLIRQSGNAIT